MADLVSCTASTWHDSLAGPADSTNDHREWPADSTLDELDREALDRANLHGVHSLSTPQLRSTLEACLRECQKLRSERDTYRYRVFQSEAYYREHKRQNDDLKGALVAELKQMRDMAERTRMREELRPELANELAAPAPEKAAPVLFKDHMGRLYKFPFEMCEAWRDMRSLIWHAYDHDLRLQACVGDDEAYDLLGPDDEIILQQYWKEAVQPGIVIRLRFWPGVLQPEPGPGPEPDPEDEILDLDTILSRHRDDDDDDEDEEEEQEEEEEELDTYDVITSNDIPRRGHWIFCEGPKPIH